MADDKTSKESKKKKVSSDGDRSEGGRKASGRKKPSQSKRPVRQPSIKRSASAGTPVAQSPAKEEKGAAGAAQSTVRRDECRKKGTVRSTSKSGAKSAEKKTGGAVPELSKKMTQVEYDKWCDTECEMWTPCTVHKVAPRRKFSVPACRLFKAETKADDVPIVTSGTILGELHERTRRYNNKTSVKVKSKKKLRKYKSSTEDKFTTKKD